MGPQTIYVIIIVSLWGILSTLAFMEYVDAAKDLKGWNQFFFFLIFIIGGPVFGINQILTALLDILLPEGWDDDDFNKKY